MRKPPNKTWVIVLERGAKDVDFVYDKRDGFLHVPRYKTESAAIKANTWLRAKHNSGKYAVKLVRKSDVRAWEEDVNSVRRKSRHLAAILRAEDDIARDATKLIATWRDGR